MGLGVRFNFREMIRQASSSLGEAVMLFSEAAVGGSPEFQLERAREGQLFFPASSKWGDSGYLQLEPGDERIAERIAELEDEIRARGGDPDKVPSLAEVSELNEGPVGGTGYE